MLGVGPEIFEDLEDFVKTGKQPFDHVYETFYACHIALYYCCIGIMMRGQPLWWVAFISSLLILALCMTLPPYEGYAGGSRQDAKVDATQKGREYAW